VAVVREQFPQVWLVAWPVTEWLGSAEKRALFEEKWQMQ
jgi:hypothetical protein